MIDRDAAGDGQTVALGGANHLQAFVAADGGSVIAPFRHLNEAHVTLQKDCLGRL